MRRSKMWVAASAVIATTAVLLGVAVPALGAITGRIGTFSEQQRFTHGTDAVVYTSAAYTAVSGASATFTIPSGTSRMFDARFTAETQCGGTSGWCTARVVYVGPSGVLTEFDPVVVTDFAMDASNPSGNDLWEGHAIERASKFLSAGTYRVFVQVAVVAGATSFRVDDWTFAVEMIRP